MNEFYKKIMSLGVVAGLWISSSQSSNAAELLSLTDQQGRVIQATVTAFDGTHVSLSREDGKAFTIGIDKLIESDQQRVKDLFAATSSAKTGSPAPLPAGNPTETKADSFDQKLERVKTVVASVSDPDELYFANFKVPGATLKNVDCTEFTDSGATLSLQKMRAFARDKGRKLLEAAVATNSLVIVPQATPDTSAYLYFRNAQGKTEGLKLSGGKWSPDVGIRVGNYANNWPKGGYVSMSGDGNEIGLLTEATKNKKPAWIMRLHTVNFD